MRVGLPTGVVQSTVDETITGLWTFINALGFLTDIITERTAAAGVTVDGLLIKDSGIPAAAVTAHQAALSLLFTQLTDSIADGQVPISAVTQHQASLSIAGTQIPSLPAALVTAHQAALSLLFTQLTDSIAAGQVPTGVVTQHQAALAIAFTQLTGQIANAQVPASAVTQHEAVLAILESQIADGSILARLAADETVTGLWEFAHASGLKTDDIIERTTNAGVLIDGVLLRARAVDIRGQSSSANWVLTTGVSGDSAPRGTFRADGMIEMGDGSSAPDANIYRISVNRLKTDGGFEVGGVLGLAGDIEIGSRDIAIAGASDDVATGIVPVQRVSLTGSQDITGFAGGRAGRIIYIINIDTADTLFLMHENVGSIAANRIIGHVGQTITLARGESVGLWYDATSSRWRALST